jgi:hypothetical protein
MAIGTEDFNEYWGVDSACYKAFLTSDSIVSVYGVPIGSPSDLMIVQYGDGSSYLIGRASSDGTGVVFMLASGDYGTEVFFGVDGAKESSKEVTSYVISSAEVRKSAGDIGSKISEWHLSNAISQYMEDAKNGTLSQNSDVQKQDDVMKNLVNALHNGKVWFEQTFATERTAVISFLDNAPAAVSNMISYYCSTTSGSGTGALIAEALTTIDSVVQDAAKVVDLELNAVNTVKSSISSVLTDWSKYVGTGTTFGAAIASGLKVLTANLSDYQNGVSETPFGLEQESSWYQGSGSFLRTFKSGSGRIYKVSVLSSTPLDPSSDGSSLYGSMMLGVPPLFNSIADPGNRAMSETFLRDARFLALTPGLPKYNGSAYTQVGEKQTTALSDGDAMIEYLAKNGLDSGFASKDKRYYVFEAKYDEYFSYLETMLNALWLKLGLGTKGDGSFDIMSFFDIKSGSSINPNGYASLKPQYNSSIGFYVNPTGAVTEGVTNSYTSIGSELASTANANSEQFQRINYLTGMGTGGAIKNASRTVANITQTASGMASYLSSKFTNMKSGFNSTQNALVRVVKAAVGAAQDVVNINTQEDLGAYIQSFATTNGMMTKYPELWNNSDYSKSVNFNFNFASPYGDPLSIFQYVYVPFCALMCFALPRQADSNGYVSPFLVRADVPGYLTSDLALITDLSWTRGGDQGLFTKDGLPRAISGTFSVTDLYPYLAMTKRLSYLSANPSYTVFLDGMAGLHALAKNDSDSALSDYWKQMLNRVSGKNNGSYSGGLWNTYDSDRRSSNAAFMSAEKASGSIKVRTKSVNWIRKGY